MNRATGVATLMVLAAVAILVFVLLDESDEPRDERPAATPASNADDAQSLEAPPTAMATATASEADDGSNQQPQNPDADAESNADEDTAELTPTQVCAIVARWNDPWINAIVFMEVDAAQAEIDAVGQRVATIDPDAVYVDRDLAYLEAVALFDDTSVEDRVDRDELPTSFRLSVPDDSLRSVQLTFDAMEGVRLTQTTRPAFSDADIAACTP